MNGHSSVSKAFSKSKSRIKPGIFVLAVLLIMLSIKRIFSPINLPLINPVWSLLISFGRVAWILFAIDFAAIL